MQVFKISHPTWGWLSIMPSKKGPALWVKSDTEETASPFQYKDRHSLRRALRKHWAPTAVADMAIHKGRPS